jgi:hypothetical protein
MVGWIGKWFFHYICFRTDDWQVIIWVGSKISTVNSYHKLILAYKILNNKALDYLKKLCTPSSESHGRNLRSDSNNNLSVIRPKTTNPNKFLIISEYLHFGYFNY